MVNTGVKSNNGRSRKVLTEKQAMSKKVGTFYHPTKNTWRSGACPKGSELRKGYVRKSFTKKNGTKVPKSYVDPVCVKNTGLPGKTAKSSRVIKLTHEGSLKKYGYSTKETTSKRHNALLKAAKNYSYSKVIEKLVALKTLSKKSNPSIVKKVSADIKGLQKWRNENPNMYKTPANNKNKSVSKKVSKPMSKVVSKKINKPNNKLNNKLNNKQSNKPNNKPNNGSKNNLPKVNNMGNKLNMKEMKELEKDINNLLKNISMKNKPNNKKNNNSKPNNM